MHKLDVLVARSCAFVNVRSVLLYCAGACIALILPLQTHAQCLIGNGDISLSEDATISLITVTPGHAIQSYWGHTALRIKDPANGIDLIYNYGAFQFDATFVPKFIYGQLDYILCVNHLRQAVQNYKAQERSLIEQHLRLSTSEMQQIFDFVENNALLENRTYRYDFLFDNCSTRLRDLLEDILGRRLSYHTASPEDTYRTILKSYVNTMPLLELGIDVGLGLPVDRRPSVHELMGLPMFMLEVYDEAMVEINGEMLPLVAAKDTLLHIVAADLSKTEVNRVWVPIALWLVFVLALCISFVNPTKARRFLKWFDTLLFGVTGFFGLLIAFLWLVSEHNVTNSNMNLLWAWPTHLWVIWLFDRNSASALLYMRVSCVVLLCVLAGWMFWGQLLNSWLIPWVLALFSRSAVRAMNR